MHLARYPNQSLPTDSAEEPENQHLISAAPRATWYLVGAQADRTGRARTAPRHPSCRIKRSTVHRATAMPSRCRQTLRGPYTAKFASQTRWIFVVSHASRRARWDRRSGCTGHRWCRQGVARAMGSTAHIGSTPYASRSASMKATVTSVGGLAPRAREKRRGLPQNLVRSLELPILPLQRLHPVPLFGRQARPASRVTLGLAHPMTQRLGGAADLVSHRPDRRPLRVVLMRVIEHHPTGTLRDFRSVFPRSFHGLHPAKTRILSETRGSSWVESQR